MKSFSVLSLFTLAFTLSAHAEDAIYHYVQSTLGVRVIQCSASLKTDPIYSNAQTPTVIISNPYYQSICDDGTSKALHLNNDETTVNTICQQAGFKGGVYQIRNYRSGDHYAASLDANLNLGLTYLGGSDFYEVDTVICKK